MLERLENADATVVDAPAEGDAPSTEIGVVPAPERVVKPAVSPAGESSLRRKRKTPVVNRRGPSEIDRAMKMSHTGSNHGPTSGRNLTEGTTSRGTIIRIDRAKGFGFVVDSTGEHRFFHRSSVQDNGFDALKEQQVVDFVAHNEERGLRALNLRPVDSSARPPRAPQRTQSPPKQARGQSWRSDLSPFRNGSGTPSSRKWKV